jgi:hypothetical protein
VHEPEGQFPEAFQLPVLPVVGGARFRVEDQDGNLQERRDVKDVKEGRNPRIPRKEGRNPRMSKKDIKDIKDTKEGRPSRMSRQEGTQGCQGRKDIKDVKDVKDVKEGYQGCQGCQGRKHIKDIKEGRASKDIKMETSRAPRSTKRSAMADWWCPEAASGRLDDLARRGGSPLVEGPPPSPRPAMVKLCSWL